MPSLNFSESELVSNRSAVLVHGGRPEDRRAWAEEAAAHFPDEGALTVVADPAGLGPALRRPSGVVFVEELAQLGDDPQGAIVRCLIEQDERPKIVLGLSTSPDAARGKGYLREDLSFRLRERTVNLDEPALREALKSRRQKAKAAPKGKKPRR